MINILIPLGGKSIFFNEDEYIFPKPIIEIGNKMMIELVINNLSEIKEDKKFIFVLNNEDCIRYHLDEILTLITDGNCEVIKLKGDTKGAICSALMAIEYINNDEKLIISNGDQIIRNSLNEAIKEFNDKDSDSGVICFNSVHPRWSFVRVDEKNNILEAVEKRPVSKNAIAGFYYFKKGKYFVDSAMEAIKNDLNFNGIYYTSSTLNEMILKGRKINSFQIKNEEYITFYSPEKISEYRKGVNKYD